MLNSELSVAAKKLHEIIEKMDQSKPLLHKAYIILRPILDDAFEGKLLDNGGLPHRKFFFGMYEDSLPAHYLNEGEFMNALSDFDLAWRKQGPFV